MTEFADLRISLQPRDQGSFQARLSFGSPGSDARRSIPPQVLRLHRGVLDRLDADPAAYGQSLAEQLFAGQAGTFFAEARAAAASKDVPLRVRLQIDPEAHQLHALRWETLGDPDPEADRFLCADERLLFSRSISSSERRPVTACPRGDLKALVVIADPIDGESWGLDRMDVTGELSRARNSLGEIPCYALCRSDGAGILETGVPILGPPTLRALVAHLREGYDILYLVCHGRLVDGQPWLWLEDEEGKADRVPGAEDLVQTRRRPGLVTRLEALDQLPRLVVLASCQSGKTSADDGTLAALGPRLAEGGVPAVVAMQGSVAMATVARFMPTFFRELLRDGQVDRAMAAARAEVIDDARPDWWMPVLFSRLESGRLFADEEREPEGRLAAPFTVPFPRNTRFVGREEELAALHRLLGGDGDAAPVGITPAGISGMGGIGKTQLAVEYAYRHQDDYPGGIFWVNAARLQDWAGELVALADRAGLVQKDPSSPDRTGQMVAALARYLQRNPRSLVIFDNVAGPRHLQTARLGPGIAPAELGGALLFTTRRRDLPDGLAPLDVEILPRAASRQMILAARPEAAQDPALEQLCATLGDLPLALELAAAALRHRPRLSITAYLENLGRLGADLLHDKARVTPDDLATYYAASLTPALQAQWEALQDENACLLLRAAAQLGEAELLPLARLGLLTGLRDGDDGLEEPLSDALRELEAHALVEPVQGGEAGAGRRLRLHPLVRDFAARQTPEAETPAFRGSLAANLGAAYEDFSLLEAHCAWRGIDALQHDLFAALALLDQTSEVSEDFRSLEADLRALLRILQREAHNLRGWDPDQRPAFFAQQVAKRATELGLAGLAGAAEAHLARGTAPYLWPRWRAGAESPALKHTLTGHEGMVFDVAVTLDGQRAISASDDRTVRLWELATGQELARLAGHEAGVSAVVPMPDQRRVMSGSSDGTLKIWDLASGAEMATLHGHGSFVNTVAMVADGRRAVSGAADCMLKVWDTESGAELATFRGHWEPVNAVAVTTDGRRVVSAASDCRLKVWDMESGDELATLQGHQDLVLSVVLTPDGQRAVSGSWDQTLRVWDLKSGEEQAILRGHSDRVQTVAVTADGRTAVSGSSDRTLRLWDLNSGEELAVLRGHDDAVLGVAITPDDQWAVSASRDGTLRVWDIAFLLKPGRGSAREMATVRGHEAPVLFVEARRNARRAVSGSADWTVKTWDIKSGRALKTSRDHKFNNDWIAMTADGRRAVVPSAKNTLSVWDTKKQKVLATLRGHESSVLAVAVTPDGRRAVSGSADWTLKVWDPESGNELATLVGHDARVRTVAISADGQRIVSGAFDRTLRVWDAASPLDTSEELWQQKAVLLGHESVVRAVALTPDGRRAVSASDDRTLRVWDTETGKELAAVALDGSLQCVALVPTKTRAVGLFPTAGGTSILAGDAAGNVYCLRYVEPGRDR